MSKNRADIIVGLLALYDEAREEQSLDEYAALLDTLTDEQLVEVRKRIELEWLRQHSPLRSMLPVVNTMSSTS